MKNDRITLHYLFAIGIFILLKFYFRFAENNGLIFLLKPIDIFIEILTDSSSVYISSKGFFHHQLNILIDKSCSGFNFFVLSFLVLTFLGLKHADKKIKKVLTIPLSIIGAYSLTIFVTTSRIFASIVIQNHIISYFKNQQHLIHEAIGIVINLSFLILTYLLTDRILTSGGIHNEKLT